MGDILQVAFSFCAPRFQKVLEILLALTLDLHISTD